MKIRIIIVLFSIIGLNIVSAHPGADDVLEKVNTLQNNPSEHALAISLGGEGNGRTKEMIFSQLGTINIDGIEYNVTLVRSKEVVSNNYSSFYKLDCDCKRYTDTPFRNYDIRQDNDDTITYKFSSLSQGIDSNDFPIIGATTVTYVDITISKR